MDRKGFLFTVTVFLVLTYILLSISVWVKAIETSERTFSEFYKESTVELAIEQVTPQKLDNVTYIIMNRNLARLNDHTIDDPVLPGPDDDQNYNLRSVMYELLVDGSTDSAYFVGAAVPEENDSSIMAWGENLNASLLAIGVYISDLEVYDFEINQTSHRYVDYSFSMDLQMKDFSNTTSVTRTYDISNRIDISGLVDPALARLSRENAGEDLTVYRQFFFDSAYDSPSSISAREVANVEGGQGWLYGPIVLANGTANLVPEGTDIAPSRRGKYILVGTFDEIRSLGQDIYNQFGGFILTNEAELSDGSCGSVEDNTFNPLTCDNGERVLGFPRTAKPYVVSPGFSTSDATICPILDGSNETAKCVLILNTYLEGDVAESPGRKRQTSDSGIFSIETARDFVMCGYYTNNEDAPSYLQRLMNDSYSFSSPYGVETFVIGNFANDYDIYDTASRLDRELYGGEAIKIMGLPGCRDYASCSDSPITGIFALSEEAIEHYGLEDIACDNGRCG